MLFSIANIGLGRDGVGVGLSISFVGRSIGVGESSISAVATGDGEAMIVGAGVGAGYLLLVSPPPRVMSHAIRTPEAPRTRTIANTQGHAPFLDSPPLPSALTGGRPI